MPRNGTTLIIGTPRRSRLSSLLQEVNRELYRFPDPRISTPSRELELAASLEPSGLKATNSCLSSPVRDEVAKGLQEAIETPVFFVGGVRKSFEPLGADIPCTLIGCKLHRSKRIVRKHFGLARRDFPSRTQSVRKVLTDL